MEQSSHQISLQVDHQSTPPKPNSDRIMGYDPHLVLVSAAIGLLLLFVRIGPFSFLLIIIISFALSALPDFRSIVDSTIGTALSTQPRLQQTFASIGLQFKPSNQLTTRDLDHSNQNLHKLDQLPDQLQNAFNSLFDLIIHDYVENWYLLPTVSTGDKAFLNQLRNALNHILLKAYIKITTKSSKETMIYLIGCLSMNLVRELNERSKKSQTWARDRITQRQVQTRRISEEILLTLGSSSITSSPITLSLVTEILTVQLISITSAYNHNWLNQSLIDSLGTGDPTQVSIASPSPSNATNTAPAALFNHNNQDDHQPVLQASLRSSQSANTITHLTHSTNSHSSSIPDQIISVQGNDVLIAYLKSPGNFTLSTGNNLNIDVSLQNLFDRTPRWTPKIKLSDSERSILLSSSPNQPVQVECLVKLFKQFELFQTTSRSAHLTFDILKADAISVLTALAPLMKHVLDQLLTTQSDQTSQENLSNVWLSVVVETLRRLEQQTTTESNIFGNLQEWILDQLQSFKVDQIPQSSRSGLDGQIDPHRTPTTVSFQQDKISFQHDKIHYMTLPNIPKTSNMNVDVQAQPSQDLASSGREPSWDRSKNGETEAVLNRHRTLSVSRNPAASPASPEWGVSPRSNSKHDAFGSPIQRLQPSGFTHPSPFSYHVPEEGDMTEGYSLDEPIDKDDLCYAPFDQQAGFNQISSSSGTPSSGIDDKNFSHSDSQPTSSILPPASHSSQAASFSVSVTDMSAASACDPETGIIKQKKDIFLLIAVEAPPEPGFIVTRGWPEFERMDLAINKKKLVGVGTKSFPRALLPTNLNLKTIDHVRRELEAYLECLLKDERYSKSEPVLKFFAKERSGMNGRGGAINNILNSTSSTLDSIGKGVASVGKEVVSKPVDFATLGLNRLSKGVFSGLPFGNSPMPLRDEEEDRAHMEPRSSVDASHESIGETSMNPERISDAQDDHDGNHRQFYSSEPEEIQRTHDVPAVAKMPAATPQISEPIASTPTRGANPQTSSNLPEVELPNVQPSTRISSVAKTEPSAVNEPTQSTKPAEPEKPHKPVVTSANGHHNPPATNAVILSGKEFDAVIIAIMSILEAAYGLDQNNTPWSMKRGVLRVIETILRTTSFSDFIRINLCQFVDKFGQVETYVDLINSVLISFTATPDDQDPTMKDYPNQNTADKPKSRNKLRSLTGSFDSIDSLDSLSSTSEALNHPQYQSLGGDSLEDPQSQPHAHDESNQKKETARKLFIDSWSSLKIGLGSNATDLAANKVFDLFQELDDQHTADLNTNPAPDGRQTAGHPKHPPATSGIELIVHNLLLDLIRITLLL